MTCVVFSITTCIINIGMIMCLLFKLFFAYYDNTIIIHIIIILSIMQISMPSKKIIFIWLSTYSYYYKHVIMSVYYHANMLILMCIMRIIGIRNFKIICKNHVHNNHYWHNTLHNFHNRLNMFNGIATCI